MNNLETARTIKAPRKSEKVPSVEGLDKYETIYYRWYINNFKDADVQKKSDDKEQQRDLSFFAQGDEYDRDRIMADRAKVVRMRENDDRASKEGEIFEHIITENIELHGWLGDNAFTFKTVEYDDRTKHVDLVVEWDNGEGKEPIKLAIDCTVASTEDVINKKVGYILDELKERKMTNVDYFESQVDFSVKPIKDIPRVILAINKDKLENLCRDFVVLDKNDPVWQSNYLQVFFLEEIRAQIVSQTEIIGKNFGEPDNLRGEEALEKYSNEKDFLLKRLAEIEDVIKERLKEKEQVLSEDDWAQANEDIKRSKAFKYIKKAYGDIPGLHTHVA